MCLFPRYFCSLISSTTFKPVVCRRFLCWLVFYWSNLLLYHHIFTFSPYLQIRPGQNKGLFDENIIKSRKTDLLKKRKPDKWPSDPSLKLAKTWPRSLVRISNCHQNTGGKTRKNIHIYISYHLPHLYFYIEKCWAFNTSNDYEKFNLLQNCCTVAKNIYQFIVTLFDDAPRGWIGSGSPGLIPGFPRVRIGYPGPGLWLCPGGCKLWFIFRKIFWKIFQKNLRNFFVMA